uniref:Uncharacterized protein n=1 Tax=Aegilops tauschii subsp. strangulata TaxID=200361 RepID=A0A453N7Z5_AEGTS
MLSDLLKEAAVIYKSSLVILQLKSLLADKERSKLLRKLSEANQLNRFLKRQVLLLKS